MERFNIVSIIPALNEENSITKIINQVSKYSDVIVINDGSEDNTSYLANKCGAPVIDHSKNLGSDASINSGFKKAKELNYEFVITLDADGHHNLKIIKEFFKEFKNQKEVIVGIREKNKDLRKFYFLI